MQLSIRFPLAVVIAVFAVCDAPRPCRAGTGFDITGSPTWSTSDHVNFAVTPVPVQADTHDTVAPTWVVYDSNDSELPGYPQPSYLNWVTLNSSNPTANLPVGPVNLNGVTNLPCTMVITVLGSKSQEIASPSNGPMQRFSSGNRGRTIKIPFASIQGNLRAHCGRVQTVAPMLWNVNPRICSDRPHDATTVNNDVRVYYMAYYVGNDSRPYAVPGFPQSGMQAPAQQGGPRPPQQAWYHHDFTPLQPIAVDCRGVGPNFQLPVTFVVIASDHYGLCAMKSVVIDQ